MSIIHSTQSRLLALAAAGAMLLAAAGPAAAQSKPVTTSLILSLPAGSIFFIPPGPCVPVGEPVALAGDVHVVTKASQGLVTEIHLNTAGMQGTGQSTGNMYVGTGSQKFTNLSNPPESDMPVNANFTLEHTDGCASDSLGLSFDLGFASDGTLLASSIVQVTPQGVIINPPQ